MLKIPPETLVAAGRIHTENHVIIDHSPFLRIHHGDKNKLKF